MDVGLGSPLEATVATTSKWLKSYQKWPHIERFDIGTWATIYRSKAVERIYHAKEKPVNESSIFRFTKLYKEEIAKARNDARDVSKKSLSILPQGRTLFLENWFKKDQMV